MGQKNVLIFKGADFSKCAVTKIEPIVEGTTITVNVGVGGGGTTSGSGTYTEGATITISATANRGYRFVSWSDGNTNATRTIIVGAEDMTYTATFEENILVDLSASVQLQDGYRVNSSGKITSNTSTPNVSTSRFRPIDISAYAGKWMRVSVLHYNWGQATASTLTAIAFDTGGGTDNYDTSLAIPMPQYNDQYTTQTGIGEVVITDIQIPANAINMAGTYANSADTWFENFTLKILND